MSFLITFTLPITTYFLFLSLLSTKDHMVVLFSVLKNLHPVLYSGCANVHSHQHVPCPPHPRQHLLLLVFLIIAILTEVRCIPSVVLICISLIVRDVEHFFIYLLFVFSSSVFISCRKHFSSIFDSSH
uniref:Uncharacterized protein n=1 Tax=Sciurus vulgaris TaxID=55149 RepID=A0A8D2AWV7_SCIVU